MFAGEHNCGRKGTWKILTVFLMTSVEMQMPITLPRVVCKMDIGKLRQKWSWILGKWVEGESVKCSNSNKEYETSDNELNDMQSNIKKAVSLANEHFCYLLPRLDEASSHWEGRS